MGIKTSDLIALFNEAFLTNSGYIYGSAGEKWTQAKQDAINKTTSDKYAMARKYGKKWIGHIVYDCSGLFHWAFAKLGGYMYHGSNTMFLKYTTSNGKLKSGKRTDGNALQPGTAVFVWKESEKKYTHVGLFIGNGNVIEAASTQTGVIKSKVSNSKWTHWGELKGVDYQMPTPVPPEPIPAGYAEVTGKKVAIRTAPTTQSSVILRMDTGKQVKLEQEPPSEWDYVSYNGKKGYMMKKFLEEGK